MGTATELAAMAPYSLTARAVSDIRDSQVCMGPRHRYIRIETAQDSARQTTGYTDRHTRVQV